MLCKSAEESHTAHDRTRKYKGRRELKAPRRPAKVGRLTLFRENRPTQPTIADFQTSSPQSTFHKDRAADIYCGLSAGRTRRHTQEVARRAVLLQAAGTLPSTADRTAFSRTP